MSGLSFASGRCKQCGKRIDQPMLNDKPIYAPLDKYCGATCHQVAIKLLPYKD